MAEIEKNIKNIIKSTLCTELPLWLFTVVINSTSIHEDLGLIPGLTQWVKYPGCREPGIGHRRSSDPALLWLWCRPAAAAPIRPLAWELLYAARTALKKAKKKKKVHYVQGNENRNYHRPLIRNDARQMARRHLSSSEERKKKKNQGVILYPRM